MDETLAQMPEPKTPAEYRRAFARYLAEIDGLQKIMAQDQIEIERSQARTWEVLAEIQATLHPSDQKAVCPTCQRPIERPTARRPPFAP